MCYELDELSNIEADILEAKSKLAMAEVRIGLLKEAITKGKVDKPIEMPTTPIPFLVKAAPIEVIKQPEQPKVEEPLIINDEWQKVLAELKNGTQPVFITGGAGVGKTTLLQKHIAETDRVSAVVAPTGVAALRAGGETIHRFCGFGAHALQKDDIHAVSANRQAKFKALDDLIVDEASMVRADLMDAMDAFLRLNGREKDKPFGGVRLILVGDLFQLPPVSKEKEEKAYLKDRYGTDMPYFFHAEAWRDSPPRIHELTTIFRQSDLVFTEALNAIRRGTATDEHLALLNSRVNRSFQPSVGGDLWLILTTTNANADQANHKMLSEIKSLPEVFTAVIQGDFDLKNAPTDEELRLKIGAIVMFIRNDADKRWQNGTLGKVVSVSPLKVDIAGHVVDVLPETWEAITYEYDEKEKKLHRSIRGKFTQIPLKLAAAITIHKSQGTTLDRAILDLHYGAFADGQTYVGLSRLRSLEGLVLRKPIKMSDLGVNGEVQKFMKGEPIARPLIAVGQLL